MYKMENWSMFDKIAKILRKQQMNVTLETSKKARRNEIICELGKLQDVGRRSSDLLKEKYRDVERSEITLNGLCYVLSECLYHLFPDELSPYRILWNDGTTHWFLRFEDGSIIETIAPDGTKVCSPEDYERAQERAFYSKTLSKRAQILLERTGLEISRNHENTIHLYKQIGSNKLEEKKKNLDAPLKKTAQRSQERKCGKPYDGKSYDIELFEQLRQRRKELAEEANVPAFCIFPDKTLVDMATSFPQSQESLLKCYGVGEVKLKKYGVDFLMLICQYCRSQVSIEKPE